MKFESDEVVWGRVRESNECIEYRGNLSVEESGQVSLELNFVPPHPFVVNMPERLCIQAQSITEAYAGLVGLLDDHGVDLICDT